MSIAYYYHKVEFEAMLSDIPGKGILSPRCNEGGFSYGI